MGYFTGSVHCVQKALALLPCPWEAIAIANLQNALAGGVAKTLARSLALSSLEKKKQVRLCNVSRHTIMSVSINNGLSTVNNVS